MFKRFNVKISKEDVLQMPSFELVAGFAFGKLVWLMLLLASIGCVTSAIFHSTFFPGIPVWAFAIGATVLGMFSFLIWALLHVLRKAIETALRT